MSHAREALPLLTLRIPAPRSSLRSSSANLAEDVPGTGVHGVHFLGQFTGLLKKFRLTKVNEKDREILTLANLDSGYVRKFVVRKVDEPVPLPNCNGGPPRTRTHSRAKYMPSLGPVIPPRTEPLPKLSEVSENEKTKADDVDGDVVKNNSKTELIDDDVVKNNVKNEKKNEEASEKQGQDEIPLQNGGVDSKKLLNGTAVKTEKDLPRSPQPLSNGRVMNLSSPKPRRKKKSKTKKSRFSLGSNVTSSSSNTDETDDEDDSKKRKRNKNSNKGGKVDKESKNSKTKNLNNNNTDKNLFGESNSKIVMAGEDDPGVCNPAYAQDENETQHDDEDDVKDHDKKSKRKKSKHFEEDSDSSSDSSITVNDSQSNSPRIHGFRSLRNSPASHRSGLQSGRSSVSSARKGILKKSGSCVTINLDLGQQNGLNKSNPSSIVDDPNDLADGARPESLPGDPQRTINRVKFILDSGKPDNISGSYDDIRIEMIEKDRMDRMDRGKTQESGYKGLSKSGRKCLLFCAGLMVLTIAVIVGSFVGSGKLRQVGSRFTGLALASDSGYGLANKYVKNAIEVKFRITNESFTPALRRPETEEYQALAQLLEKELKNILVTSEIEYNGNSALKFKIIKFDPGSIITTFRIAWLFIDPNTTPPPPLNITIVRSRLEEYIKVNGGAIAKYQVPVDTLSVDRVVDICSNNASLCSNECVFSHETLRFSCLCPDFMILVDQTTCIDQRAATTTTTTEVYLNDIFSEIFSKIGGNVALISIKNEQKDAQDKDEEGPDSAVIVSNETSTAASTSSTASSPATTTVTTSTTAITPTVNVTTVRPEDNKNVTLIEPSIPVNETVSSITASTGDRNVSESSGDVETQDGETGDETVEETVDSPPAETVVDVSSSSTTESSSAFSSVEAQSSSTTMSTTVQQSSTSTSAPQQSSTSAAVNQQLPSAESDEQKSIPSSTNQQSSTAVTQESSTSATPQQSSTSVTQESSTLATPQQSSISSSTVLQQSSTSTTTTPQPSPSTTSTMELPTTNVSAVSNNLIPIVVPESLDSNEVEQPVHVTEVTENAENSSTLTSLKVTPLSTTSTTVASTTYLGTSSTSSSATSLASTTPKTLLETSTGSSSTTAGKSVEHPSNARGTNSSINVTLIYESDAEEAITKDNDTISVAQVDVTTKKSSSTTPTIMGAVSSIITSTTTAENLTSDLEKSTPDVNAVHEELPKMSVSTSTANPSLDNETLEMPLSTTEGLMLHPITPIPQIPSEKPTVVNEVELSEPNITLPMSVIITTANTLTSSGEVQNKSPTTASDSLNSTTIEVIKAEVLAVNDGNLANNTPPPVPTSSSTTPPPIVLATSTVSGIVEASKDTSNRDQALSESVSVEKILAGELNDSVATSDPELLWSFNNVIPVKKAPKNTSTTMAPSGLCTDDMHECGGRCLPRVRLCDAVPDCADGSDENNCVKNSCFLNFQCWSGDCVARRLVCDGVTDCPGGDDEQGCNTWSCLENEFRCESIQDVSSLAPAPSVISGGPCLPLSLRCDGQPDCFNHTDERHCVVEEMTECDKDKFQCPEGWCIPDGWRCDGITDCERGEDERGCECAGLDEAACAVGGCVPTFHLCDGLRQCPDGSDEWGCVRIRNSTRRLEVRSGASLWRSVCGDGWTSAWSDLVCEQLVGGSSVSTEVRRVQSPAPNDSGVSVPRPRVSLASDASTRSRTPLQYALSLDQCSSDALVHLKCHHDECGSWDYSPPDPEETRPEESSQWPSLAILLHTPPTEDELPDTAPAPSFTHPCAASILSPMWLITAYSCLASQSGGLKPDTWAVVTGEGAPSTKSSSAQLKHVSQVLRYPGAKRQEGLWTGDLALIRLVSPLSLDQHTSSVCVASSPNTGPPTGACVFANWRPRVPEGSGPPFWLQLQALPDTDHINLTTCNSTHYRGRLSNAHMCAQLDTLQPAPCHGDEGSPLMCQSSDGSWRLEGLLSHHSNCGTAKHPAVFTATGALETWILNTIGMAKSPKNVPGMTSARSSVGVHASQAQAIAVEKASAGLTEAKANDLNFSADADVKESSAAADVNKDKLENEDVIFAPKSVETVVAPLIGDSLNPTVTGTLEKETVIDVKTADTNGNVARESRGETLENENIDTSENVEPRTVEIPSADTSLIVDESADLIANESAVSFSSKTHATESSLHHDDPGPSLISSNSLSSPASSVVSVSSSVSSSTSSTLPESKKTESSSSDVSASTTPRPSPSSPLLSALAGTS
ncbi:SRCR-like domain [Trinorchestia longiramus]|nr:SRCR-like domain [Trinorchestia longiramus]